LELCTGFSLFEGVCAKRGFPQSNDFRKSRRDNIFRMKLRAGDFLGFGEGATLQKSGSGVFEVIGDDPGKCGTV
jgi:hypothetical protein